MFPGVHKIGAAISGPGIAVTNFMDTRIFLIDGKRRAPEIISREVASVICVVNTEEGIVQWGGRGSVKKSFGCPLSWGWGLCSGRFKAG